MLEANRADDGSFSSVLSVADRDRLRIIVRQVHLKHYPQDKLTNYECDKLIDAWGPDVAGRMIKAAVDRGLVG
jgi:hypothetical protein